MTLLTAEEIGPIPWQCWDIPGFKECHTEAGHRTHRLLVSMGAEPGSAAWNTVYPNQHRREVQRCEILSNCAKESIDRATTPSGASTQSDILSRLEEAGEAQEEPSSVLPKVLAVAALLGVGYFAYTRMRS